MLPVTFDDNFHSARVDYADVVVLYLLIALAVCFLLGVPGPGFQERLTYFVCVLISWSIGVTIVALQVTRRWEIGQVNVRLPLPERPDHYPQLMRDQAVIVRLNVGLSGVNVTFATDPSERNGTCSFHFNEAFDWAWAQGRDGFGPFAGLFNRQFRRAQSWGLPRPVLSAVEMLTHDSEGIRLGRHYRRGGWHARTLIWISLGSWMVANMCLLFSLAPAARMWSLTGALLVTAAAVWAAHSPAMSNAPAAIRFGQVDLILHLDLSFYACLVAGIASLIIGALLYWLDVRHPQVAAVFFGLDPLVGYDECYCHPDELGDLIEGDSSNSNRTSNATVSSAHQILEMETYAGPYSDVNGAVADASTSTPSPATLEPVLVLRRRGSTRFRTQSLILCGQPSLPDTVLKDEDVPILPSNV